MRYAEGRHSRERTTLAAVVAEVVAAGTLTCAISAWRASRLDPLRLIRED